MRPAIRESGSVPRFSVAPAMRGKLVFRGGGNLPEQRSITEPAAVHIRV